MKTCGRCNETKELTEFHKHPNTKDGRQGTCKKCSNALRNAHQKANPKKRMDVVLRSKYGITRDEYIEMAVQQSGRCLGCGKPEAEKARMNVDHNHETKEVRGLLCNSCNRTLGYAQDSPEILRTLANYLEDRGYYG